MNLETFLAICKILASISRCNNKRLDLSLVYILDLHNIGQDWKWKIQIENLNLQVGNWNLQV